jgi:hypothetical protein
LDEKLIESSFSFSEIQLNTNSFGKLVHFQSKYYRSTPSEYLFQIKMSPDTIIALLCFKLLSLALTAGKSNICGKELSANKEYKEAA